MASRLIALSSISQPARSTAVFQTAAKYTSKNVVRIDSECEGQVANLLGRQMRLGAAGIEHSPKTPTTKPIIPRTHPAPNILKVPPQAMDNRQTMMP
jgi:hypothetical protein